jgi:serine phosphatase RsbU (regulator of sigma subunit)/putative methionine-R-sulfoxide reductase with GAF domain
MDKAEDFKKDCIGLYSELHLDALLESAAAKICEYLECEQAAMFLYDSVKEELSFEIVTGDKKEELKKITMKKGEGIVGWAAENEKSVVVNDCANDPRFTAVTDKKTHFITSSLAAVPVKRGRKLLGVLEAVNKIGGKFDEADKDLLEQIAAFISIPLLNAMLYKKLSAEANEKGRLIELGKIVSHSFDLEEVFKTLKDVITDIIDPLEINVMVKSQGKTYQLLTDEKVPYHETGIEETVIEKNQAVFPLRVKDETVGYLELKTGKKIPGETESLIRGVAIFAAISIEKYEMHDQIVEKKKLEKELDIARNIQQSFLPGEEIVLKGLDVACANISSSAVGGDYYDVVKLNDNKVLFTIDDVSGHGIPASLLMAVFSANFKYRVKRDKDILTTICHLNDLIAETTDPGQYVTSFTCLVDLAQMKITYIDAGHLPPFLFRGKEVIELDKRETVLGMFCDIQRTSVDKELKKGDVLVLYTDGIVEAEDIHGEPFSEGRLKDFIMKNKRLKARKIKEKLILELKRYVNKDSFVDDVTFIVIKIL